MRKKRVHLTPRQKATKEGARKAIVQILGHGSAGKTPEELAEMFTAKFGPQKKAEGDKS